MGQPDTIVLIHGLFMTALSWEHWVERYTNRGFRVVARSWPGMNGDIDELRKDPSAVEHLGIIEGRVIRAGGIRKRGNAGIAHIAV